jgi:hypothetical protein
MSAGAVTLTITLRFDRILSLACWTPFQSILDWLKSPLTNPWIPWLWEITLVKITNTQVVAAVLGGARYHWSTDCIARSESVATHILRFDRILSLACWAPLQCILDWRWWKLLLAKIWVWPWLWADTLVVVTNTQVNAAVSCGAVSPLDRLQSTRLLCRNNCVTLVECNSKKKKLFFILVTRKKLSHVDVGICNSLESTWLLCTSRTQKKKEIWNDLDHEVTRMESVKQKKTECKKLRGCCKLVVTLPRGSNMKFFTRTLRRAFEEKKSSKLVHGILQVCNVSLKNVSCAAMFSTN